MSYRLRELREDNDIKQQTIAELLNCNQQTVSNYERGFTDIPTASLIRLAEFYHTSTDYILGVTNRKEPYPKD